MFQQDLGDIDVIVIGRVQQRSLPLVVLAVHVGPLVAKVFRHGKVAVISRVDQWCETMAVGLIDVHTLGQVVVNRCDILINGGGVDAFDAAAQEKDGQNDCDFFIFFLLEIC